MLLNQVRVKKGRFFIQTSAIFRRETVNKRESTRRRFERGGLFALDRQKQVSLQ